MNSKTAAASTLLLAGLLLGPAASAADIQHLTVDRQDNRYLLDLRVALDTSAARAFAVMRDYPNLADINPAVQAVTVLPGAPPGATRVQTAVRVCVLWFCRVLEQVQDMRHAALGDGGTVSATVLPALSNLRYGQADWLVTTCDDSDRACLRFTAELEPDFWVPPVIGPWALKRKLREEGIETSLGIERVARAAE